VCMYNRIALAPILIGVNCVYSHICIYTACAYIYIYIFIYASDLALHLVAFIGIVATTT